MAKYGQVTVFHQEGTCVYEISGAAMTISDGELDMGITTSENKDCRLGILGPPSLAIESASVSAADMSELTEEEINVAVGWDTEEEIKEDNIFRIYLAEHHALDNNKVLISRCGPEEITVSWRADATDFNYCDERAKRNAVEVQLTLRGETHCPSCDSLLANPEAKYCPICERHWNDRNEEIN